MASKSSKTTISLTTKQVEKLYEVLGNRSGDAQRISGGDLQKLVKELEQLRKYKQKQQVKKKKEAGE